MTVPRRAKLAFLTQPSPGIYLLNLRVEGEEFYRLEISKAQLSNVIVDGAAMALRASVPVSSHSNIDSVRLGAESFFSEESA